MGLAVYASRLFVSWAVILAVFTTFGAAGLVDPGAASAAPAASATRKKAASSAKAKPKAAAKRSATHSGGKSKAAASRPAKSRGKRVARATRRSAPRPRVTRRSTRIPLPESVHDDALLAIAASHLGTPYRLGGASKRGMDCSGFTRTVFSQFGVELPHSARAQFSMGERLARWEIQPGDLVFFRTYRRDASHVGIYIGDGLFIHAAAGGGEVRVDDLDQRYFRARYLGARRLRA